MKHNFEKYDDRKLTEMMQSRWKKNRDGAFTEVYNRYSNDIFIFLSKMLQNDATTNDIFQDTFMNFYDYAKENPIHNMQAFLRKIARNLVINYFRDKRESKEIEKDFFEIIENIQVTNNQEKNELKEIFKKAVEQLSPKKKELYILKYYMHCNYKEIEKITGINESNLGQLLYRTKLDLRALLKPYYKEIIEEK